MPSPNEFYYIGRNDYRYGVDEPRFDDPNYIEGFEQCKHYMRELGHPRLPFSHGNILVLRDVEYEGNKIPIVIEKPRELLLEDSDDQWQGFNNGDFCVVTLYVTTRHYGGPEEGGWWYNWDHHHTSIPTMFDADNISGIVKMLLDAAGDQIGGDIYSVLGGAEGWIRIERVAGSEKSTEVPHYE